MTSGDQRSHSREKLKGRATSIQGLHEHEACRRLAQYHSWYFFPLLVQHQCLPLGCPVCFGLPAKRPNQLLKCSSASVYPLFGSCVESIVCVAVRDELFLFSRMMLNVFAGRFCKVCYDGQRPRNLASGLPFLGPQAACSAQTALGDSGRIT